MITGEIKVIIDKTKEEVVKLLKQREEIENKIKSLDKMALIRYELEKLSE